MTNAGAADSARCRRDCLKLVSVVLRHEAALIVALQQELATKWHPVIALESHPVTRMLAVRSG